MKAPMRHGGDSRASLQSGVLRLIAYHPLRPIGLIGDIAAAIAFGIVGVLGADDLAGLAAAAFFVIAVLLRRMSAPVSLLLAWVGAIIQMASHDQVKPIDLAILAVLYAGAAYGGPVMRWVGLASAGVGAAVAAAYLTRIGALGTNFFDLVSRRLAAEALQFAFLFVVAATVLGLSWVLGIAVRAVRSARASRFAEQVAQTEQRQAQTLVVVEQERNRIARDMHDVVAHSLAIVIAQADGARYAKEVDPTAADTALETIAVTAREALADVRVLLAELRHDQQSTPQPGIEEMSRLIDQLRGAGLDIRFSQSGQTPTLGAGHQVAVYRIAQEALTNALRHGDRTQPVRFDLGWSADGVTLSIVNAAAPTAEPEVGRGRVGHGVPGMRERATLAGGSLTAERVISALGPEFHVTAFVPSTPTSAIPLMSRVGARAARSSDGAASMGAPAAALAEPAGMAEPTRMAEPLSMGESAQLHAGDEPSPSGGSSASGQQPAEGAHAQGETPAFHAQT